MGQLGFFDLNRRYESLDKKSDPLAVIAAMVPFESFRPKLKAALIKGELRKSRRAIPAASLQDFEQTTRHRQCHHGASPEDRGG